MIVGIELRVPQTMTLQLRVIAPNNVRFEMISLLK